MPEFADYARFCNPPYFDFYRRYGCQASEHDISSVFNRVFRNEYARCKLYPVVPLMLKELQARRTTLVIVSANDGDFIAKRLQEKQLYHHFRMVCGGYGIKSGIMKEMASSGLIDPKTTLMVGDACSDMRCSRDAGIAFRVGLTHGSNNDDALRDAGATRVVEGHHELISAIRRGRLAVEIVTA